MCTAQLGTSLIPGAGTGRGPQGLCRIIPCCALHASSWESKSSLASDVLLGMFYY